MWVAGRGGKLPFGWRIAAGSIAVSMEEKRKHKETVSAAGEQKAKREGRENWTSSQKH